MITSKFIWDSFEKHSDELFYVDSLRTVSYKEFYQKIVQVANQNKSSYRKNKKVVITADSSFDFLIENFAVMYSGALPVLISSQTPKEQRTDLVQSIIGKDSTSSDNATIIFTSGSTSIAKAVMHTYSNHYYSALGSSVNLPFQNGDRWLLSLPLHHIGGLSIIFRALLGGGTLVGYDKSTDIAETIQTQQVTHISLVATQLRKLLDAPDQLKSLKAILVGGGFIGEDLITHALDLNLPIYKTYGMSEMSSQVTTTPSNASPTELQTSGKVLKYREIKITDDNEILVKGEVLALTYLNAEMHIDSKGWFHTGDIGSLDKTGNLTVLGRKDNMFISGGENIYPEPIEKILIQMHNFSEVSVVPKDDSKFGQIAVLFYKSTDGEEIELEQIKNYLLDKVQHFEIPKEIHSFPKEYQLLGIKLNRSFLKNYLNKK